MFCNFQWMYWLVTTGLCAVCVNLLSSWHGMPIILSSRKRRFWSSDTCSQATLWNPKRNLNPTASTVNPMTIQWNPQLVLPRCQCLSDSHDSVRCVKLPRVDTTQWSRFFENLFCARTSLKAFEIKNVHSGLDCRRMSWGTFECPLRFSKKSWMFFRCI